MRMKFTVLLAVIAAMTSLGAQGTAPQRTGYLTPPQAIVDIMSAEPLPGVAVSPTRDVIALTRRTSMPSIAEVSQPMLRLAGMRINPKTNGPHRAPSGTSITLRTIATGAERNVVVPAGAKLASMGFSPDGKRLAFTNTRETGIDLYIADVATGQ